MHMILQHRLLLPFKTKQFNVQTPLCFSSICPSVSKPTPLLSNPNLITAPFSHLLKKCSTLSQLEQVHAQIVVTAVYSLSLLGNLIRSYTSFGNLTYARIIFDRFPSLPTTILWNSIIQAYSKTPNFEQSLHLFRRMLVYTLPDDYTFTSVISASSRLSSSENGICVHGQVIRNGFESSTFVSNSLVNLYSLFGKMDDAQKVFDGLPRRDVITWTSLVSGYAKCGELGIAEDLFEEMPEKNDVSWTVMIVGYVRVGRYNDALRQFHDMLQCVTVKPNEAILVCVLSACAHIGALDQGKWIHIYIDKSGVSKSSNLSTALIDMYAKCGRIDCANRIFEDISRRDIMTWTSIITGLGMHGHGKDALRIFSRMLKEGIKPDNITLLGVLNGCSHSGLVDEGCLIFYNMNCLWGVVPKIEHYGCLIDLLGRAGQLEKAFHIAKNMPMEPDIIIWRALLSACRIHGNVSLGEQIIDHVVRLDPSSHGGGFTLLSNLYASTGRWDKVAEARKELNERKIESKPGFSWIEIEGIVHEFLAADKLHPRILEIHDKLNAVLRKVSLKGGYVANTKQVLFDLSEEEKEQAVSWHSEKLAIAFGLMCTKEGSPIRIVKNLRICEDCHSVMKAISRVYQREIVVRDRSRFHTFRDGNCSCMDYW